MTRLKLASWNVNGLRSISKKGFFDWLDREKPDIVGLQETKIADDQLTPELTERKGYRSYFSHADRRGYSGVALYVRQQPQSVVHGFGTERFDREGRTVGADFGDFMIYNVYFPNGKKDQERLQYKLDFYDAFLEHLLELRRKGKSVLVCGDFNTAHKAIDLARPRDNEKTSGFLPEERQWLDRLVNEGFIDTFRHFDQSPENYSWWHMRTNARARNVGWRIDYFFASEDLRDKLAGAGIQQEVAGSDHCPVTMTLELN